MTTERIGACPSCGVPQDHNSVCMGCEHQLGDLSLRQMALIDYEVAQLIEQIKQGEMPDAVDLSSRLSCTLDEADGMITLARSRVVNARRKVAFVARDEQRRRNQPWWTRAPRKTT